MIELVPTSSTGYWFRARYYENRGNFESSYNDWKIYLDKYYVDGKHYGYGCFSMSIVCSMLKKEEEAQKWLQKVKFCSLVGKSPGKILGKIFLYACYSRREGKERKSSTVIIN